MREGMLGIGQDVERYLRMVTGNKEEGRREVSLRSKGKSRIHFFKFKNKEKEAVSIEK